MTEAEAWIELERWRWGDATPTCPHCGCTSVHYVEPQNRVSRKTTRGPVSARRVWKCHKRGGGCGKQFTALVGSRYHGTKVPVVKLVRIIREDGLTKGVRPAAREYGLDDQTIMRLQRRGSLQ